MGCGVSTSVGPSTSGGSLKDKKTKPKVTDDETSESFGDFPRHSVVFKVMPSEKEARNKFEQDGTLMKNSDSNHLALRQMLDEPISQNALGKFAAKIQVLEIFMCWVDIQEYKLIPTDSYRRSKALHIYHKYIKEDAALMIGCISPEERSSYWSQLQNAKNIPAILTAQFYDSLQSKCFIDMYHSIYLPFKQTDEFLQLSIMLKNKYNKVKLSDFEYYTKLGEGGFGFVLHCKKKSTGTHYAMKIQTKVGLLDCYRDEPSKVLLEKDAFASLQHPFIVNLYYAFQTPSLVLMVLDLADCGDLHSCIANSPNGRLSEDRVRFYIAEIILALAYLHQRGLIYRDLKPQNVLLNANGHVQLVDLGGVLDDDGAWTRRKGRDEALIPLFSTGSVVGKTTTADEDEAAEQQRKLNVSTALASIKSSAEPGLVPESASVRQALQQINGDSASKDAFDNHHNSSKDGHSADAEAKAKAKVKMNNHPHNANQAFAILADLVVGDEQQAQSPAEEKKESMRVSNRNNNNNHSDSHDPDAPTAAPSPDHPQGTTQQPDSPDQQPQVQKAVAFANPSSKQNQSTKQDPHAESKAEDKPQHEEKAKESNTPFSPALPAQLQEKPPDAQQQAEAKQAQQAKKKRKQSIMGTLGYMAPEMVLMLSGHHAHAATSDKPRTATRRLLRQGYTHAVDWWSLGVTAYKLLTGVRPFADKQVYAFVDLATTLHAAVDENSHFKEYAMLFQKLSFPSYVSPSARDLIQALLDVDDVTRLGAGKDGVKAIKRHPFFANLDWEQLEQKQVEPPYIPPPPPASTFAAHNSNGSDLRAILTVYGKASYLEEVPSEEDQAHFETWDFISAHTLRVEAGLSQMMEQLVTNPKARRLIGDDAIITNSNVNPSPPVNASTASNNSNANNGNNNGAPGNGLNINTNNHNNNNNDVRGVEKVPPSPKHPRKT